MRTKEALARRKQEGMTLGRKKGDTPKIKLLRANKRVLTKELDKGTTYSELAEKMGVSRTTLFRFMKNDVLVTVRGSHNSPQITRILTD